MTSFFLPEKEKNILFCIIYNKGVNMKKGLEWYKVEMMKDTREYTNTELTKMLEEEFQIPIIITTWIEDEKNQEVYEIYRQLRK